MAIVSVIIRTKNEEKWIGRCLRMVCGQSVDDIEVIVVDNGSSDNTLSIARKFPVSVLSIDEYRPGRALNLGVTRSSGEFVACLSGHCLPRDSEWLAMLLSNMKSDHVAAVYGRQLPLPYTPALDKRDLLLTFGQEARLQTRDFFLHNANSMIRRTVWRDVQFDEDVTNVEDLVWGKAVIERGHTIRYEPRAAVYHYHGIHHSGDLSRVGQSIPIIEALQPVEPITTSTYVGSLHVLIATSAPSKVSSPAEPACLQEVVQRIGRLSYAARIAVICDEGSWSWDEGDGKIDVTRLARRPATWSTVGECLQSVLADSERGYDCYDAVLYCDWRTLSCRAEVLDGAVERFARTGRDSVIYRVASESAGLLPDPESDVAEFASTRVGAGSICVTSAEVVRHGQGFGRTVGIFHYRDDPHRNELLARCP